MFTLSGIDPGVVGVIFMHFFISFLVVDDVCRQIVVAVRCGHAQLAASFVAKDMKTNGIGSSFSKFHLESLTGNPG